MTQKRLSGAIFLHVLNTLFYKELEKDPKKRTFFEGVILGIDFTQQSKSRRVYVKLDHPSVEIKVYGEDIDYHNNCRYAASSETFNSRGCTMGIAPIEGSFREDADEDKNPPKFQVGDRVKAKVGSYAQFYGQTGRSRWVFMLISCKDVNDEKEESLSWRNSTIEKALWEGPEHGEDDDEDDEDTKA